MRERPCADGSFFGPSTQQQIADHRRRQHERQREQHIQHTFEHARQTRNVIGRRNPREEDDNRGNKRIRSELYNGYQSIIVSFLK